MLAPERAAFVLPGFCLFTTGIGETKSAARPHARKSTAVRQTPEEIGKADELLKFVNAIQLRRRRNFGPRALCKRGVSRPENEDSHRHRRKHRTFLTPTRPGAYDEARHARNCLREQKGEPVLVEYTLNTDGFVERRGNCPTLEIKSK